MDLIKIAQRIASRSNVLGQLNQLWGLDGIPPDMRGDISGPWTGTDDYGRPVKITEGVSGEISVEIGEYSWSGDSAMREAVAHMKSPPVEESPPEEEGDWAIVIPGRSKSESVSEKELALVYLPGIGSKNMDVIRVNRDGDCTRYTVSKSGQTYGIVARGHIDEDLGWTNSVVEVIEKIKRDADIAGKL